MKKILLVLVLAIAVSAAAFSEFDPMSYPPPLKGENILADFGVGLELGFDGDIHIPPIYLQVEYCLPMAPVSVGGSLTFARYRWRTGPRNDKRGYDSTYITPAGRANWHFGFDVPNFDFYAGSSMGYNIVTIDHVGDYSRSSLSGFHFGLHAGIHYYFSDNFGINVEGGFPYWSKVGFALKF